MRRRSFSVVFAIAMLSSACSGDPPEPAAAPPPAAPTMPVAQAPAPPPPPAEPPAVLAGRRPGMVAEPCINRFSGSVREILDGYLQAVDRESGPRGNERVSHGYFYFPTGVEDCKKAVEEAAALTPPIPEFDKAARAYAAALEAAAPVIADAKTYYQREGFRDDDWAHARELHPQILARLDAFIAADEVLAGQARAIEALADEALLARLAADPAKRAEFLLERARVRSAKVMDLLRPIEPEPHPDKRRSFRLGGGDTAAFSTAVSELQVAVDELLASPGDDAARYEHGASAVIAAALAVSRALRDDEAFSSPANAYQHPQQLVDSYNSFIQTYNLYRRFR